MLEERHKISWCRHERGWFANMIIRWRVRKKGKRVTHLDRDLCKQFHEASGRCSAGNGLDADIKSTQGVFILNTEQRLNLRRLPRDHVRMPQGTM